MPRSDRPVDMQLLDAARDKKRRGKRMSAREVAEWNRYNSEYAESYRRLTYDGVPAREYLDMAGLDGKRRRAHAHRYGVPIGGEKVNGIADMIPLAPVLRWIHDLLTKSGDVLNGDGDGDMPAGVSAVLQNELAQWQIAERKEKAAIARITREELERTRLPRAAVHELLGRVAEVLRTGGETMRRQFGGGAADLFDATMDDIARMIGNPETWGSDNGDGDTTPTAAASGKAKRHN